MGDRLNEDLGITLSSLSQIIGEQCTTLAHDNYHEDEDESEGESDYDEEEEEEVNAAEKEAKSEELACPFCTEDFDVLGLCCHIDADHRMDVKPGICPVCSTKVRINMASHVITQHDNILKALCIKKNCSVRNRSSILLLRSDLQKKHLRNLKESHSDVATDSKLMLFVNNPHHAYRPQTNQFASSTKASICVENRNGDLSERRQLSSSTDWNNERTKKCEFSQGIVLSTIFDDL